MSNSDDAFRRFVTDHQARIPLADWPQLGTEAGETYWGTIRHHLSGMGATLKIATDASIMVAKKPSEWLNQQQGMLLDAVEAEMRKRSPSGELAREPVIPERRPGPWDAIETLQDLKDFIAALGPVAARVAHGRPDARPHPRRRQDGAGRALPELARLALPPPDPDLERERQRQRAALSLRPPQPPQPEPPGDDDQAGLDGAF